MVLVALDAERIGVFVILVLFEVVIMSETLWSKELI